MINDDETNFDDDALELDDSGFDDFDKSEGNTLADLWKNKPLFKVGVVVGGLVLGVLGFTMLSQTEEAAAPSVLPAGPDVAAPPGSEGSSPAYIEALVDQNTDDFEKAVSTGGSAIPMPIESSSAILSLSGAKTKDEEDPLQRWRRLQEERLQRERDARAQLEAQAALSPAPPLGQVPTQLSAIATPEQLAQRSQTVKAMADRMVQQMQAILDNKSTVRVNSITLNSPSYLEDLKEQEKQEAAEAAALNPPAENGQKTLLPAGEILYAQLITEANSDVPGPVLAEIMSGPFKGSRILGSFQVQKELLTLNFNSVVIDDVTYPVQAVAIDPETTLPAMATDVDHHYLKRIFLPAAAAFVEGAASAISETGNTTITISGDVVTSEETAASNDQEIASGIDEVGQELRSILDEIADETEVTVIIAAGTPMGILFTQPVIVPDDGTPPNF